MMTRRLNVAIYGAVVVLAGLLIGPTRSVAQVYIDGTQYCDPGDCDSYTIPSSNAPANPTNETASLPSGNAGSSYAIITQASGSNVLSGDLTLGTQGTSNSFGLGLYNLQGGSLSANNEFLGAASYSQGVFTQSGGTNTATNLDIEGSAPPAGTTLPVSSYTISGGSLVSNNLYVGANSVNGLGDGAMTIGANAQVSASFIGVGAVNPSQPSEASYGALTLDAGASLQFGTMYITVGSVSAMGNLVLDKSGSPYATYTVSQSLGTSVSSVGSLELGVANGNNGSYYQDSDLVPLTNNSISAGAETIGLAGSGFFRQNVGTNTIASTTTAITLSDGSTQAGGSLVLGAQRGSSGTYALYGGTLQATSEVIGAQGAGAFIQSGGSNTTDSLTLAQNSGAIGSYDLLAGTLLASTVTVNGGGTFKFDGGSLTSSSLTIAGGAVTASGNETIAEVSPNRVSYTQSAGSNTVTGSLELGYTTTSNDTYTLSTTNILFPSTLSAGAEMIGLAGTAAFIQTGGINTIASTSNMITLDDGTTQAGGSLILGGRTQSSGSYTLSGGTLQATYEIVGGNGIGTFIQSGGSNTTSTLTMALNSGATGSYALQGGTLSAANLQVNTGGSFKFDGGSLSTSNVAITGGAVTASGDETATALTSSGVSYSQTGGSNFITGALKLGDTAGSTDSYTLSAGMLAAGSEVIGASSSATFTQSGGSNTTGTLTLAQSIGATGSYDLRGGTLLADTVNVNDGGIFKFDGGSLQADQFSIGFGASVSASGNEAIGTMLLSTGASYLQTAGGNSVTGALELGVSARASDSYSLGTSGPINLAATLTSGAETFGLAGSGRFTQNSGTNTIASSAGTITLNDGSTQAGGSLVLGAQAKASGSYTLNGGSLQAGSEVVGASGSGTFTQSGGGNTTGALTVAQNSGASGSYTLRGGTLSATNVTVNAGGALQMTAGTLNAGTTSNGGTVSLSGGISNFNGIVTNQATGTLIVDHGAAAFNQAVVNDGTFKVEGATVLYGSSFTNNGTMVSDPSKQSFSGDLIQGSSGVIQASAGDIYAVGGGFLNHSTQNTAWNTLGATLEFTSEGTSSMHTLLMTGTNLGATLAGYNDNFAWGTLSIDAGQSVSLETGTASDDVAFYVENLLGAMIAGDDITNIDSDGFDIFYNPHTAEDDYLDGGTFSLVGGGQLIADQAAQVPEPASLAILLSGLAALAATARRQRRPAGRGRS